MQYFGGKSAIAESIVKYLESIRGNRVYIEPFVGGASVVSKVSGVRFAYDKHPYLIAMYRALQEGWIPPDSISEEEYTMAKNGELPDYLTGFIGFGCSFAGKWFGGYARNKRGYNYCLGSKNSLLKKIKTLHDVDFKVCDYIDLTPNNNLIYCDPPYKGTTQYGFVGNFDSNQFWNTVREWSKNNMVIVSEYNAPDDFECVWSYNTRTQIRDNENKGKNTIEKLFMLR